MLEVQAVEKTYASRGGAAMALSPTTLAFAPGSTTVLIGPSGCGKSTLLRILLGLIERDAGRVLFDGVELTPATVQGLRQKTGYVLQDGGLFPHLSARANVTLLAEVLGRDRAENDKRVDELADLVQLARGNLDAFPSDLSGGQRQRVSLMRALMLDPEWVLLDEPLGALDPITRRALQAELRAIFDRLKKTVILVTHDMGEAAFFAGEIVLMRAGKIVQRGSAQDLRDRPAEPFVAEFVRAQRSPLDALPESGRP